MNTVKIGNVEITALQDSPFLMNPRVLVPEHADEMLVEWGHQLDARQLLMNSITTYLLRSEGKNILIDTGVGGRRRPGMPPGKLDETLAAADISPSEIDLVIHTHLHIDHVGWNTIDDADGKSRVFFDRARFMIQQIEWDYWMTPEMLAEPRNLHLVECVKPLEGTGRIDFRTGESAIDANLTFVPTPGHTPGHVAVGIHSAGERAIINFRFTDIEEDWILGLQNSVLRSVKGRLDPAADATLTLTRLTLLSVIGGDATFVEAIQNGEITIDGDGSALLKIFGHLDTFMTGFAIVEP